jgi:predicted RNA-binding Zn ribbon-like protein
MITLDRVTMSRDLERAATQFFGGRVCLDFGNTLDWRTSAEPQELIPNYGAFLGWCDRRRTMASGAISNLRLHGDKHPRKAGAVMREAYMLRAEIWNIARASCERRLANLSFINRMVKELPKQPELIRAGNAYVHDLRGDVMEEPLWPILWSMTALLTSNDALRIGMCRAKGCGWFFVDESPNRSRLWCSSEVCGNRERARRAYAKRRSKPTKNAS